MVSVLRHVAFKLFSVVFIFHELKISHVRLKVTENYFSVMFSLFSSM